MTFNSFSQLAEKFKTETEQPENELESTPNQGEREDIAPEPTASASTQEIHNFGDIYATFDPQNERYD